MNSLIRLILLCFTLFALLILASILAGHTQVQPEFFQHLERCAGIPCYDGIVPGESEWSGVQQAFTIQSELKYDTQINLAYGPSGYTGTLQFFPSEDGHIFELDLIFHTTGTNIGSVMVEMGTPCGVALTSDHLALVYPGMYVLMIKDRLNANQFLAPTTSVRSINLLETKSCNELLSTPALRPWRGFGRYVS